MFDEIMCHIRSFDTHFLNLKYEHNNKIQITQFHHIYCRLVYEASYECFTKLINSDKPNKYNNKSPVCFMTTYLLSFYKLNWAGTTILYHKHGCKLYFTSQIKSSSSQAENFLWENKALNCILFPLTVYIPLER